MLRRLIKQKRVFKIFPRFFSKKNHKKPEELDDDFLDNLGQNSSNKTGKSKKEFDEDEIINNINETFHHFETFYGKENQ